jgi:hypothetical protein
MRLHSYVKLLLRKLSIKVVEILIYLLFLIPFLPGLHLIIQSTYIINRGKNMEMNG